MKSLKVAKGHLCIIKTFDLSSYERLYPCLFPLLNESFINSHFSGYSCNGEQHSYIN